MSGNSDTVTTDDVRREKIREWLMQEGFSVSESPDPKANWLYIAKSAASLILIGQPKAVPDQILIQASLTLRDIDRNQIAALTSDVRDALLWDLKMELLRMGVEFEVSGTPPEIIICFLHIYDDGLTKDGFCQRVSLVKRAILAATWVIGRTLEQPPSDTNMGFTLGNSGKVH